MVAPNDLDPLTRLAIRYGTDKWGPHFYTPIYHSLLSTLRSRPIRLLEIGVGGYNFRKLGGASLLMWADYFPHGKIVGLDIASKTLALGPRITFVQGSQTDVALLERIDAEHGPFDIVIDDGSHVPQHVVISFQALFPKLTQEGIYIIEDVQTAFWPRFGGTLVEGGETLKLANAILQAINYAEITVAAPHWRPPTIASTIRSFRAYHNVFVIEKGDNREPSNARYAPDNPHAARAVSSIERELQRAPSSDGYAHLATIYSMIGQHEKASDTIGHAISKWTDQIRLYVDAANVAARAKKWADQLRYLEHAIALDPNDVALQKLIAHVRARLSSGGKEESASAPRSEAQAPES